MDSIYSRKTLFEAVVGRAVVYMDGKLYHVRPHPMSPAELDTRDTSDGNMKALALKAPRGTYLTLWLDSANRKVYISGYGDGNEIESDKLVWSYNDIIWDFFEPDMSVGKLASYGRPRFIPMSHFVELAVTPHGGVPYSVLDGWVIRALWRPRLSVDKKMVSEQDLAFQRSQPDMVQVFNNILFPAGIPVEPKRTLQLVGKRWAFADMGKALAATKLPVEGASVQF